MTKKIITVEGMHCMHCAGSVEKAVSALEGVKDAKVNLDKKVWPWYNEEKYRERSPPMRLCIPIPCFFPCSTTEQGASLLFCYGWQLPQGS